MSAYVVEDSVINNILSFLYLKQMGNDPYWYHWDVSENFGNLTDDKNLQELGQKMLDLNIDAVNQRYNESDESQPFSYRFNLNVSWKSAYKNLSTWRYQCYEGNVPETDLFKKMTDLYNQIAHYGIAIMLDK